MVEAHDAGYGLLTLAVRGGRFVVARAAGDDRRAPPHSRRRRRRQPRARARQRELHSQCAAGAHRLGEARSTPNEIVAVIALGADGDGARILSRAHAKIWEQLGLAEGVGVHAQVKAVALAPGRGEFEG